MATTLTLRLRRPHPGQAPMLHGQRRFNVADCGRRFGKTQLGEERAARAAATGAPVGWFSPTYRMLAEVWREMGHMLRPLTAQVHVQDRRIDLVTGGVVEFWSLETPDVARGRKYRRVIIDEAAMVPGLEDAWQAVIRPTLTDLEGDAWFLSTPRGFNFFHTLYQRGQDAYFTDWASWQMPTSANPFIPARELVQAEHELPPRVFNQEYLAQFEDDATTIYSPTWWQGQNRYTEPLLPVHLAGRWLSWDTAVKETDTAAYSACVVAELSFPPAEQLYIREVYRDRLPFPSLVDEVRRQIARWNTDGRLRGVLIEDKSSGASLVQTLQQALPDVPAGFIIPFTPRSDKGVRAQQASVWCRNGQVLLPEAAAGAPWLRPFEAELYAAPFGPYMDQADAFAQIVFYLEGWLARGYYARMGHGEAA